MNQPTQQLETMQPIEAAAQASRNGHAPVNGNGRRRQTARSRIEAAAAAATAAVAAAEAAAIEMRELFSNRLIARLDAEDLGRNLDDADIIAVLHLVRRLDASPALPQRTPDGSGPRERL